MQSEIGMVEPRGTVRRQGALYKAALPSIRASVTQTLDRVSYCLAKSVKFTSCSQLCTASLPELILPAIHLPH